MRDITVAAAQFESRDDDKQFNLSRISELTRQAKGQGAEIVSFHEGCVPGYSWLQPLSRMQLLEVAEPVPDGPSTKALIDIAAEHDVVVMAGLIERDTDDQLFNCYVTVGPEGFITRFHKLHPFVNPHLSPGDGFHVIELRGCKVGFLICYDNNLPENVRVTTMMGAEIIFMPHVTGCLPSVMPGRGLVDPQLWENRERDPAPLRMEFAGPKGRGWLMRWLPARAYDNGIYAIFTNPIGLDDGEVRNGNSMILDPYGEVIAECMLLGDDVVVGLCTVDKFTGASGRRYIRARRPELYGKLVEPSDEPPVTAPGWTLRTATDD